MGGRGSSSGKAGGGGGAATKGTEQTSAKQKPTNAKAIENMNEAQLDNEIAKQQKIIASADKVMGNTPKSENIGAMPLGQLTRGKTQAQKDKIIERSTNQAKKFTEAYDKKKMAETTLKNLEQAKKSVKGTGKTQKQINSERTKKAVESAPKALKWKTTAKGGFTANGGYQPKIIKAGNFEIHGTSGYYTVYRNGKQVGSVNKLSTAKALAERMNKK